MCTCLDAVNGECGLRQEVLVIEHVNLINHKAQEGKGRVAYYELEWLSGPRGVQTVISWRGQKEDGQREFRNVQYVSTNGVVTVIALLPPRNSSVKILSALTLRLLLANCITV